MPWAPPPWTSPARRTRTPWLLAVAVLVVVIVVVGTGIFLARKEPASGPTGGVSTTAGAPSGTTATAGPTVAPTQLESFLLSPEQINTIVGTTGIVIDHNATEMTDPGPENSLSTEQCLGALIGYQTRTYKSSGYTGMLAQLMQKPRSTPGYVVVQGAVIFASADQAVGFVATQADQWRSCAGKDVTQLNNGKTSRWTFRDVSGAPPKISLQRDLADSVVVCQHVLSAVSNIVLDVNVCAPNVTDQASEIADTMAAKVPT